MVKSFEEICKEKYLKFLRDHNVVVEDEHTFEFRKRLLEGINLNKTETVQCVAGIASASLGFNVRKGLLLATNERILLLLKKGLRGTEISTFYYNRISSIGYKSTMTISDVMIYTDGDKEQKFNTEKPEVISSILQNLLNAYKNNSHILVETSHSNDKSDIVEKLERIFQLKQAGALSEVEYEELKKNIINN
ncbi:PH domain-containing protein (plasmid) [Cytobacillus firmus]|uniref:PH domain-containing protein n=1 Tax=Cytobacillus firmus TaxID=1399 RepID=UPI00384B116B